MACDITLGRALPCKDVVGGITNVIFVNYDALLPVVLTADDSIASISGTASGGSFSGFEYDLKGNSSFEQTFNSSRENGTTFFTQTLNLTLTKLSKTDNKQLKLLAYGRPYVFVTDYNGNTFMMGRLNGAEVTGGTIVTGAAMGDLSGYTLTMEGQEVTPANFLDGSTATNPFAGVNATAVIVKGSNS